MSAIILIMMTTIFSQQPLTEIDRAAQAAELFWDQFSAVQSIEHVTQTRIRADGKVTSTRIADFDYVALLKSTGRGVAVEESRVPRSTIAQSHGEPLLLTTGFPALLLMFHPNLQDQFEFRESPVKDSPPGTVRIEFRSRAGERSMSALKLNGRTYPILWKGSAWIEQRTGGITRIEADLASPMEVVGLEVLHTEVEYKSSALNESGETFRLPSRVIVSARSTKQQWRNTHEFSAYKVFTVTTTPRHTENTER